MNNFLAEKQNVKQAIGPVDLNTAANTGARIKMSHGDRVAAIISLGTSTTATVEITLRQHDAATAGNSKDLDVDNPYYVKADTATSFTKVVPTVADALLTLTTTFTDDAGTVIVEVLGEQLDDVNGYSWFSVDIADSAAAKLGSVVYVVSDCRFSPAYSTAI